MEIEQHLCIDAYGQISTVIQSAAIRHFCPLLTGCRNTSPHVKTLQNFFGLNPRHIQHSKYVWFFSQYISKISVEASNQTRANHLHRKSIEIAPRLKPRIAE